MDIQWGEEEFTGMIVEEDGDLAHYGTPRHSGRYPWGSGENPYQRDSRFMKHVNDMKKAGISENDRARSMNMTVREMRARYANADANVRREDVRTATKLKNKGWSYSAIARAMGITDNGVRSLLDEEKQRRKDAAFNTANMLEDQVKEHGFIMLGEGANLHMGISQTKMENCIAMLKDRGYVVHDVYVEQLGTGKNTHLKVLGPKGSTIQEAYEAKDHYALPTDGVYTEDQGDTWNKIEAPKSISSKRVYVNYTSDDNSSGGVERDGMIYLRRGVDDISLKDAHYAQVRILVDGDKYMKGMAVYSDDIPDGYDIVYHTNKTRAQADKVFKKVKDEQDNPFGATIRTDDKSDDPDLILCQRHYKDKNGKEQLSALNIVNEEGNWGEWGRTLSAQLLSKQPLSLARKQLNVAFQRRKDEFDELMGLTQPTVQRSLLLSFADACDASAVHLKAAAIPGSSSHVIISFPGMKKNEIYAPNFEDGTRVALVRYPHGGRFEIAELTVNNKFRAAKEMLGLARDAVGIHPSVAAKLSGADFDGDTVTVIPNNSGEIKSMETLKELKGYEPKILYAKSDDQLKTGKPKHKNDPDAYKYDGFDTQLEMGKISNLITDMTIKGAPFDEIARAVRHSMTVIDAEKHNLDWKQSYIDNGIAELKEYYQGGKNRGSSTLISLAKHNKRVPERKEGVWVVDDPETGKGHREYYDPETGKKLWSETGRTKPVWKKDKDGNWVNKGEKKRMTDISEMMDTDDAFTLSSGTYMEEVYAEHANKLKALANEARKAAMAVQDVPYSRTAFETYTQERQTLRAKLNDAIRNKPVERQAQAYGNYLFDTLKAENPNMSYDEQQKARARCLAKARKVKGAHKKSITFTDREWEAIQAGAIRPSFLKDIIANADKDEVKRRSMPRSWKSMSPGKLAKARSMLKNGSTQAEVAQVMGVSVTTLMNALRS